jgi:hypothetical protein
MLTPIDCAERPILRPANEVSRLRVSICGLAQTFTRSRVKSATGRFHSCGRWSMTRAVVSSPVSVTTRRCAIHSGEGNICLRLQTLAHCSRYEAFSGGQSSAQGCRYQPCFAPPTRPPHCAVLRRVQRQRLEAYGRLAGPPASDRGDDARP